MAGNTQTWKHRNIETQRSGSKEKCENYQYRTFGENIIINVDQVSQTIKWYFVSLISKHFVFERSELRWNKNFPLYFFRGNVFGILMSDVNIDRNHVLNEKLWIQYSKTCLFFVLNIHINISYLYNNTILLLCWFHRASFLGPEEYCWLQL